MASLTLQTNEAYDLCPVADEADHDTATCEVCAVLLRVIQQRDNWRQAHISDTQNHADQQEGWRKIVIGFLGASNKDNTERLAYWRLEAHKALAEDS
jgi:hypothetical protein